MKRYEVADLYPDKKAREKADEVIEGLPDEAPMTEYIRRWELAYLEAGGIIRRPKKGLR